MRSLTVAFVFLLLPLQVIAAPFLGPVAKDSRGKILTMTYHEALAYCSSRETQLPTARQYAEAAVQKGATGIRETAYPGIALNSDIRNEVEKNKKEGFQAIYRRLYRQESAIDFYFNKSGFKDPEDDLDAPGDLSTFWSESVFTLYGEFGSENDAYVFSAHFWKQLASGQITEMDQLRHFAVRCMLGQ